MLLRHLADIDAINQDMAAVDVIKAWNQADQRRFARACATDNRRDLAWARAE